MCFFKYQYHTGPTGKEKKKILSEVFLGSEWSKNTIFMTASAALQEDIDLSKARGRKRQSQITWSSRLGVRRWASNPSLVKQIQKLKILPNSLGWSKLYDDNSYGKGQWILEHGMSKESSIKWTTSSHHWHNSKTIGRRAAKEWEIIDTYFYYLFFRRRLIEYFCFAFCRRFVVNATLSTYDNILYDLYGFPMANYL